MMKKIPTIKINKIMIDTIKMIKKEVIRKEMNPTTKTIKKKVKKQTKTTPQTLEKKENLKYDKKSRIPK